MATSSQTMAVIADVHGNLAALEAVLADIDRRGVHEIINLGDSLYGPLQPAATAELLLARATVSIAGNQDRELLEPVHDPSPTLRRALQQLTSEHLEWLASLPSTTTLHGSILLCHGTPEHDDQYLLWQLGEAGASLRPTAEVMALVPPAHDLVLCGHDHVPRLLAPAAGPTVVDPGSVGLPAYIDEQPWPHVMETGSPHARYAIVSRTPAGIAVDQVAVPYDWQAAASLAAANGRGDWQSWLLSGRAHLPG